MEGGVISPDASPEVSEVAALAIAAAFGIEDKLKAKLDAARRSTASQSEPNP